jgi:hypothetical protein
MKLSKLCEKFLKHQGINCVSIDEGCIDPSFNPSGCDCCEGLATDTYECSGYDPERKEVVSGFAICGECINYFYNGEDCEVQS